jgi:hypothetical protein
LFCKWALWVEYENTQSISYSVLQGVLHHEIAHSLLHGSREFYEFRFTAKLQKTAFANGLDLPILNQYVYLLSIAIKDLDVVKWLTELGLGYGQQALIEFLMNDTEEEKQVWDVVHHSSVHARIAIAAFLKTILPIEALISEGFGGAPGLLERWNRAYGWVPERERAFLIRLCRMIAECEDKVFQERLEYSAFQLITEPFE